MTRIAVLGNSHVGALKRAWENGVVSEHPGTELVFFGAPRDGLKSLEAVPDGLKATDAQVAKYLGLTSGLADPVIRPAEYDAILLHGLVNRNWTIPAASKLSRFLERNGSMPSSGLFRAVMEDAYAQSVQAHVIARLPQPPAHPLFASPQPYTSEDSEHNGGGGSTVDHGIPAAYEAFLRERMPKENLVFLPQPPQTVANGSFTRKEFFDDAERLLRTSTSDEEADHAHTNAAYGALVLKSFFATLGKKSQAPAIQRNPATRKTRK